eukprot:tig00020703_g13129.t2
MEASFSTAPVILEAGKTSHWCGKEATWRCHAQNRAPNNNISAARAQARRSTRAAFFGHQRPALRICTGGASIPRLHCQRLQAALQIAPCGSRTRQLESLHRAIEYQAVQITNSLSALEHALHAFAVAEDVDVMAAASRQVLSIAGHHSHRRSVARLRELRAEAEDVARGAAEEERERAQALLSRISELIESGRKESGAGAGAERLKRRIEWRLQQLQRGGALGTLSRAFGPGPAIAPLPSPDPYADRYELGRTAELPEEYLAARRATDPEPRSPGQQGRQLLPLHALPARAAAFFTADSYGKMGLLARAHAVRERLEGARALATLAAALLAAAAAVAARAISYYLADALRRDALFLARGGAVGPVGPLLLRAALQAVLASPLLRPAVALFVAWEGEGPLRAGLGPARANAARVREASADTVELLPSGRVLRALLDAAAAAAAFARARWGALVRRPPPGTQEREERELGGGDPSASDGSEPRGH